MSQLSRNGEGESAGARFAASVRRLEEFLGHSIDEDAEADGDEIDSSSVAEMLRAELANGGADLRAASGEIKRLRAASARQVEMIAELKRSIEILKGDRDRAETDREMLDQKLRDLLLQISFQGPAALGVARDISVDGLVDQLRERLALSEQQLAAAIAERALLVAEANARTDAVANEKDGAILELTAKLAESEGQKARITEELAAAARAKSQLSADLAAEKHQRSAAEAEFAARLTSVYKSTSWWVTKPLRFAGRSMMRLGISRHKRPVRG